MSVSVTVIGLRSLTDQIFSFTNSKGEEYIWNVSEGRRLAERRNDILTFTPGDFNITTQHIRQRYPQLDVAYALSLTIRDLSRPLLFLPFEEQSLLLDRWHRLYKAVTVGVQMLPCYQLTKEEADHVRVRLPSNKKREQTKPIVRLTRFEVGRVTATPNALIACARNGVTLDAYLQRHQSGDFGEVCSEDRESNRKAILHGYRILSEYALPDGLKLWIITEADRSSTTALLSEEY